MNDHFMAKLAITSNATSYSLTGSWFSVFRFHS